MSFPPSKKNSSYNSNVVNGGLIDFQDNHLASCAPFFSPAAQYATPSPFTSTGYQFNSATGAYNPVMENPMMYMGAQTGYPGTAPVPAPATLQTPVSGYPGVPNTQVFMGAPSEVYVQGRVYKAVDDTPAKPTTAAVVAPVKAEVEDTKVDINEMIKERIDNKVDEYMSRNSPKTVVAAKSSTAEMGAPLSKKEIIAQLRSHNQKFLRSKNYSL